ncbi:hypothetical protein AX17_001539 [Amanita inopinata Kibby_2008]|nr:hypothetical protein AX17_001539 [Amanita inopinata Kibby_2008]
MAEDSHDVDSNVIDLRQPDRKHKMLDDLPSELLLTLISYLHVSDIYRLRLLSKAWNEFITENESAIYHAAAILHCFAPSSSKSLDNLHSVYSSRALGDVSSWKNFCSRMTQIKKSWIGRVPSTITLHQFTGDAAVHRFKVDEHVGLIVATTRHGGLIVTNLNASRWYDGRTADPDRDLSVLESRAVLWALPRSHVRSYAHCEYGQGYLIFDRFGGSKEVWRLAEYDHYYPSSTAAGEEGSRPSTVVATAQPDERQLRASQRAREKWMRDHGFDGLDERVPLKAGHFVPWALLHPPSPTRAFRFVYPILLVASFNSAYLFDVRTGAIIQQIRQMQLAPTMEHGQQVFPDPPAPLGELNYVELGQRHVFICAEACLRIFSRQNGQKVLDIPHIHDNYGRSRWLISMHRESQPLTILGEVDNRPFEAWKQHGSSLYKHKLVRDPDRTETFIDRIAAAHVSSCGNYLAVMLQTARLLIIRDLERVIKGERTLFDSTIEIQLGRASRFSRYLAFEDGRVGVATRNGIFIVIPDPSFFSPNFDSANCPPPTVLRVHALNDPFVLESITCLQITPTGLFLNWSPTCPLVRNIPGYVETHRRNIHSVQDDVFWSGLESPLIVDHHMVGVAFVEEEENLQAEPIMESTVLSVDFVPT